jgi:hypothetical protein
LPRPGLKVHDLLPEIDRVHGVIDVPHVLLDFVENILETAFTAGPDFEEGMQEAFDNHNDGKQAGPSVLGRLLPVGIDGLGCIIGVEGLGFCLEDTIGLLQGRCIGLQGQRCPQDTILPDGRSNVAFGAVETHMFLVRQQMLWQIIRRLERGTHQFVAPETRAEPIPVGIIASENIAQRPKGHPETPQKQGFLYFIGQSNHIWQNVTGGDGVDLCLPASTRLFQAYAPQLHLRQLAGCREHTSCKV